MGPHEEADEVGGIRMSDGDEIDNASKWDLDKAIFSDSLGTVACCEALRRYGAADVTIGYVEKDAEERWPEQYVTAFAKVKWRVSAGLKLGRYTDYEEVRCEIGTEIDRTDYALNEAVARIIRKLGGNVTIVIG